MLGRVIRDGRAVRVADLSAEPGFDGFPAGHPVMHCFLGLPFRAGERVFGNVQLVDRWDGQPFDDEDEVIVDNEAVHRGVEASHADRSRWSRDRGDRRPQRVGRAGLSKRRVPSTAAWVRRCRPSLAKMTET